MRTWAHYWSLTEDEAGNAAYEQHAPDGHCKHWSRDIPSFRLYRFTQNLNSFGYRSLWSNRSSSVLIESHYQLKKLEITRVHSKATFVVQNSICDKDQSFRMSKNSIWRVLRLSRIRKGPLEIVHGRATIVLRRYRVPGILLLCPRELQPEQLNAWEESYWEIHLHASPKFDKVNWLHLIRAGTIKR